MVLKNVMREEIEDGFIDLIKELNELIPEEDLENLKTLKKSINYFIYSLENHTHEHFLLYEDLISEIRKLRQGKLFREKQEWVKIIKKLYENYCS